MITNLVEGTKTKCHQYWPNKDSVKFGPFEVFIIDQQILADYTIRTLLIQVCTTVLLEVAKQQVCMSVSCMLHTVQRSLHFQHNSCSTHAVL